MSLSIEDYKYFDAKFEALNKCSDAKFGTLHEKVNTVRDDLSTHAAAPCGDTVRHIADCHDPLKFWGTVAAVVAVMSGLAAGLIWLIQHA
jgi:hypothetical protein